MAEFNKYWTGQQRAFVPDNFITADWAKGDGAANRLRMLNGAFEIYFMLKSSIALCTEAKMRDMMTVELDKAGEAGSGFGVCDMDDAFQHWMKPGPWTDNNLQSYMNANGVFGSEKPGIRGAKFVWGLPTNIMPGPRAAANFFDSLDSKMKDLSSAIRTHNTEVGNLSMALGAKDGQKTLVSLTNIAKVAKVAQKFMFLAPKPNDSFLGDVFTGSPSAATGGTTRDGRFGTDMLPANETNAGRLAGQGAITFMQATQDMDTFLTVHKNAMATGIFDNRTSTAFAALAVACGKVPILGGFYAEIIKSLPGFFGAMQNMFQEHNRRIVRETFVNN